MRSLIRRFYSKVKSNKNISDKEKPFGGADFAMADASLKEKIRSQWLEETYVNYSEDELSLTNKNFLGLGLKNSKIVGFLIFLLFCLSLLLARTIYLQIVCGSYYLNVAEKNRIRIYDIIAPRGIIYDVLGHPLVKNIPSFAVFITPFDFNREEETRAKTIDWLKKNLGETVIVENLNKILSTEITDKEYFEPVLLLDGIDYEKAIKLRIESEAHLGTAVEVLARRQYLNDWQGRVVVSLAHILGYEGRINPDEYSRFQEKGYLFNDYLGKTGIEKEYEEMLRGQYGREQVEINSSGKTMKILAREEVKTGVNIYLSLDINMQVKLEEIIKKHLAKLNIKKAAAVVMNPQTGKIYSLVSLPGYDNNIFSSRLSAVDYSALANNPDQPLFNRVISGEYPSGSTIKPVIGAAALEEGIINDHSSFLSVGGIKIEQWFFPDWKAGGHGVTDIRKAIADSVNTFFYIIGGGYGDQPGLGVYKIKEYAEKFGLFKRTGIDLPGEQEGFLPTPEWKESTKNEKWYIGDTYHLAIGQGDLLVTPIQVANYTAVFANQGKLMKPELVERYLDQTDKKEKLVQPVIVSEGFVKQNNIQIIREGMRQAVRTGSARILNGLPVASAAKTGTAQWGGGKTPHAWFTAFAPYINAELVITVMVEEGGEGSSVAASISYEFMNWYFREYKKQK